MPRASLIRRVRFSAGHRYWRSDWSEERNRASFGASVSRHGHNYDLEVTVLGEIDPETGFVVDLGALDEVLRREVVERFDQKDLNEVLPEVREGTLVPSTENLARWLWNHLAGRIPGPARLQRIRLYESDALGAEYEA